MALGHEIWGPITGPTGSAAAVARALGRCSLDFGLLKPGLLAGNAWSAPGKTQIPVNVRSLANFLQEAEANGWREGIDFHAIMVNPDTGDLVGHDHVERTGLVASESAAAVLGLFWFYGLVEVEESLLANPVLFDEVFHSEGAHATDFYYMLPTGRRDAAHAIICTHTPRHAWFQPSPYFDMPGEGFMGIFVAAFTDLPITLRGFSHPAVEPTVTTVKKLLVPVEEPPVEPPVTPPVPPVVLPEVAPGIWDARSVVTKPEGTGLKMGTILGSAVHHTVTRLQEILDAKGEGSVAAFDALIGEPLAAATMDDEIAHIKIIDAAHKQSFGLFAYHMIVFASGRAYWCGELDGQRAHVAGRNHELLGVAAVGDFSNVLPGEVQLKGIAAALKFMDQWPPGAATQDIRGHNLWALPGQGTICAGKLNGFDWTPYLVEPLPPQPVAPHVVSVFDVGDHFLVKFAGSGVLTITDGDVWPLHKIGSRGDMEYLIE